MYSDNINKNKLISSVLVTGANGFVGSRLCRKLISKGFKVIAGIRKTANLSELDGVDVEFRYGDVSNIESLSSMVENVDYIIHNAGITKAKMKRSFFEVNEKGTENLFESIHKNNPQVKRVVYISSLAAAGCSLNGRPVRESDSPRPMTTYGESKLAGERSALSYKDKLNVVAVRPPGVYGPGDKEIFGFFAALNFHLKPYVGKTSRKLQLVHVDDLCEGIYSALTKETPSGEIYFIAEENSYSMKELIKLLKKGCGKSAIPVYIPSSLFRLIAYFSESIFRMVGATPMLTREKADELLASWEVSTDKAYKELGFKSKISFEDGASETYRWYREKGWLT